MKIRNYCRVQRSSPLGHVPSDINAAQPLKLFIFKIFILKDGSLLVFYTAWCGLSFPAFCANKHRNIESTVYGIKTQREQKTA
jgi:hypothetical protein